MAPIRMVLRSKIHRATVTQADLDYIGSISIDEDLMEEYEKLINAGNKFFIVDLNEKEIESLFEISSSEDVIVFNVRSKSDLLRNEKCKKNLFHIPPSYSMLSDALTQYLVKKKWKKCRKNQDFSIFSQVKPGKTF